MARVCMGRRKYRQRSFFFPCFLPLPDHHLFRSALDELAGRSGRGPEDDLSRLDTRSLLQFLRNSVKERSLAAAPADLLPACTVCQVKCEVVEHERALLLRHVCRYRKSASMLYCLARFQHERGSEFGTYAKS